MKISDKNNSLDMTIARYEFPDDTTDEYASNWLVVQLLVYETKGSWVTESSCLLTYEARSLAGWLNQINKGNLQTKEVSFLEPILAFSVVESNQEKILRVHLFDNVRPVWAVGEDEYLIDFALSEIDLKSASDDLRKQLEKYPQRAVK